MKYAMFFISALIITILSGCEHQGNNPPEENPLEGYTVLQADDDNVHLSVYVDTVENWTILKWYIDAVDSAEHEYTVGNEVVFYSVVTDIPSHLDVAYGNQEVLLIDMYGHMAGENPDYADIIARSGSMKVLKHEGDAVKGGEAIAVAAGGEEDGRVGHLHFELWRKGRPVNPEQYIVY